MPTMSRTAKIVIRDTSPLTVLSIGARGAFDATKEFETLREWLKGQDDWVVAGDPRMFVYKGPFIDPDWRWNEVQVPIRRKSVDAAPTAAPPPSAAAPAAPGAQPRA